MSAVRVGVVGAGQIAQVAHLVVLNRLERVEVVGICDIDVAKARALAGRFGVPEVYDDIEDLLRYARPDAVVVCTPNHLHEVHVVTALSAGVHVMCERPLALGAEGFERVEQAQRRAGRIVFTGMNHRYRSDVRNVHEFLAGGELGALRAVRGGWYIFRPQGVPAGWRERPQESGGGAMLDLGLPLLDLALWLTGCPRVRRVSAAFAPGPREGIEDGGCALLACDRDLSIWVDVSWRHVGPAEKLWFEVIGEHGSARVRPLGVYKEMHGVAVDVTPGDAPGDAFGGSYRAEWLAFLAAVRGEGAAPDLDEQRVLFRTLEAIRRSAHEGRDVSW